MGQFSDRARRPPRARNAPRTGRGQPLPAKTSVRPRLASRRDASALSGRRKQQVGPHAETGAQPRHHRHAQPLVPVQDFADGGVASSSRTPAPTRNTAAGSGPGGLRRMSDSGTTATSAAPLGIPLAAPERTWSGNTRRTGLDPLRTSGVSAIAAYPLADRREWIFLQSLHAVCSAERRSYCGVHGTLAANLNRFLTSRLLG